ncbi:ABC transporter permease [Glaciibacter psychrotolerans]|uniref:Peptide/nickel transport system permease protein n=1 Tax=Glaciibacter psychrotolerans TaxID=670054 RepID=A0A7Z0J6B4_9MICO|nr:ABC transporter permease [Leifsonia psychrotolerans]NYJ19759.1 peptide/nickel transport system permease protein [Leifsonia psychrotolerans]
MSNIILQVENPEDPKDAGLTIEQREVIGLSQGTIVRRRFFRHKGAMISIGVLVLMALLVYTSIGFTFFGLQVPGWWRFGYEAQNAIINKGNPTWTLPFNFGEHPFGQDEIGRDIFARVMRGTQQSIVVTVLFGGLSAVIGVVIGSLAGFYRGKIDQWLMRLTDLFIIFPLIILGAVLGRTVGGMGAVPLGIVLGLIGWTSLARLVRGEFLSLREREFVDAARVAGADTKRIIFKHILPNAVGVVIVSTTLLMSGAILAEAALSFLSFGIKAPDVSLGQLINEYQGAFTTRPWLFWWPGLFIIIIALGINFIGDGLRDAFDPRQRRIPNFAGPYRQMGQIIAGWFRPWRKTTTRDAAPTATPTAAPAKEQK